MLLLLYEGSYEERSNVNIDTAENLPTNKDYQENDNNTNTQSHSSASTPDFTLKLSPDEEDFMSNDSDMPEAECYKSVEMVESDTNLNPPKLLG